MAESSEQPELERPLAGRCAARLTGPARLLVSVVADDLERLVDVLFGNADDYFFDMANGADSAEDQAAFFEAMRLLRLQRDSLKAKFFGDLAIAVATAWAENLRTPGAPSSPNRAFDLSRIALLSDAELEISAALSMISNRGQALHGRQIGRVTATINAVSRRAPVDEATNPLGVKTLARLFAESAGSLALTPRALARLLALFERDVIAKLGDTYARALEQLEAAGTTIVEPRQREPRTRPARRELSAPDAGSAAFDDLRATLVGRHDSPGGGRSDPTAAGVGVAATVTELVDHLSVAQSKYLESLPAPGEQRAYPNLKSFLIATPTSEGGFRQAGELEVDTLTLVSELFEHIFRNEDVSLACMSLIARLQFPVLKVALTDKSFFSDREHPARRFLNQLARDGVGWPSNSALLLRHRLYRSAEELIVEINDQLAQDADIFAQALTRWNEQAAKKSVQTETADRRINETELGKAKLNAARSIVERVLNRTAGRTMPRAVADFISDQWSQVLVLTCIKFGTSSDEWRQGLDTFNQLLTRCTSRIGHTDAPGRSADDHDDSVALLLQRLQVGIDLIGLAGTAAADALNDVRQTLYADPTDTAQEATQLAVMEPVSIADGHAPRARKKLDPRLEVLTPGTWIEVTRPGEEEPLRCRLVVLVDQTQAYVFASDDGLKVYERSAPALLEELLSGTVRVIEDAPLIDRAVSDLVDELNDTDPDSSTT